MKVRFWALTAALMTVFALPLTGSAATGSVSTGSALAASAPLAVSVITAMHQAKAAGVPLDSEMIFAILCGGGQPDEPLAQHLRQIANSLAERDWTPPRVVVRSVVRVESD